MDGINALFELGGAIAVIPSIMKLLSDRHHAGVSAWTMMFFSAWGWWNLLYYPHLDQMLSTIGAAFLAVANTTYLILLVRFGARAQRARRASPVIALTAIGNSKGEGKA